MTLGGAAKSAFKSSSLISWKRTGKFQQTVRNCLERTGRGLHSGKKSTVRIWPELAGEGRYFDFKSNIIRASIDYVMETPLCTTLSRNGYSIRTVEHLLSALEATGVDNCRIQIESSDDDSNDPSVEVPIFDGSAREWVEGIGQVGLKVAEDGAGHSHEKLTPFLNEPVYVWKNDAFVIAFPYSEVKITYGIDFPQVEKMRNAGLISGGSTENAIVCSVSQGWLNPPLRFSDEPCRHKVLDLIGDISLFARAGSEGLPVAHIIAHKSTN